MQENIIDDILGDDLDFQNEFILVTCCPGESYKIISYSFWFHEVYCTLDDEWQALLVHDSHRTLIQIEIYLHDLKSAIKTPINVTADVYEKDIFISIRNEKECENIIKEWGNTLLMTSDIFQNLSGEDLLKLLSIE